MTTTPLAAAGPPSVTTEPTATGVDHRPVRHWPQRISLLILLAVTAVLYLWTLSESGYANSFYSAAAQAGSQSWKAFFFGSLDAGNVITVDKPPASLWLMGLSVRLFGLSSWSILVPQALLGVATVAVVYATVRRVCGHGAGLAAGLITALTPSAVLMFRFNNPDALLLFALVLAGYGVLRATERASARWLIFAGALVGLGFLTKMLQAFLVLPAFALVYLIAAPTPLRRRLLHLLGALAAMIISAGWWVAVVELWPASSRPYIDGSTSNSVLDLVFGYNGLGRLTGDEPGQVGGAAMGEVAGAGPAMGEFVRGAGGGGFGSETGLLRLFQGVSGGMISWLIPAALILLVAGLIMIGRQPRTDRRRMLLIMYGTVLLTTAVVFSFMAGIYHDYYTVALAPWIAGTMIIGGSIAWRQRHRPIARISLAAAAFVSAGWGFVLLGQSGLQPYLGLRWLVLGAGLLAGVGFLLLQRLPKAVASLVLVLAGVSVLTGPAAYSIQTVGTAHRGSIVTAGPQTGFGGPGGGMGGVRAQLPGGGQAPGGQAPPGQQPGGQLPGTGAPPGQLPGQGTAGQGGRPEGSGRSGGMGGLLNGAEVSEELKSLLTKDSGDFTWVAATARAQNAASYQLATEHPVIAIGGFNGTANRPTLEQFKSYVGQGRIHYYIGGGDERMPGDSGQSSAGQIQAWVEQNFTAQTVDGVTLYDLTEGR